MTSVEPDSERCARECRRRDAAGVLVLIAHRTLMFMFIYLLLLPFPSHVTLLNVPVAKEVPEVAEDGEDAITHVGEHGHQERSLLKGFHKRLLVQAGVVRDMLPLGHSKVNKHVISRYELRIFSNKGSALTRAKLCADLRVIMSTNSTSV